MIDDPTGSYVQRVRVNTRRYLRELLTENLRLQADAERCDREAGGLRRQVEELRDELRRRGREHRRLLELVGSAEGETRRFEERYIEVEQQNSGLAALYAASYQLHGALARSDVLGAVKEIVVNLVGSEELAVLSVDRAGALVPLEAVGVDARRVLALRADLGVVGRALAQGAAAVGDGDFDPQGVSACVPLAAGGHTIAILVIFRLLPQKVSLGAFDLQLFGLLATHASAALYCAELHERHGERS